MKTFYGRDNRGHDSLVPGLFRSFRVPEGISLSFPQVSFRERAEIENRLFFHFWNGSALKKTGPNSSLRVDSS